MNDLAILIIDMQKEFVSKLDPVKQAAMIASQMNFIKYSMQNNLPIINVRYESCGKTLNPIRSQLVKYRDVFPIKKSTYSVFEASDVDKLLCVLGAEKLFIMGVNAMSCVYESAVDASRHYEVHVADDLIGSPMASIFAKSDLEERKKYFKSSYNEMDKKYADRIFYHDDHKKFIEYIEKKK
ncbi:MAG TPA: isochorismatase family protein [Alphaproteobacteria bacterium]|nr:isochorismatase family protein [Alphaproteobacteria bacterium]